MYLSCLNLVQMTVYLSIQQHQYYSMVMAIFQDNQSNQALHTATNYCTSSSASKKYPGGYFFDEGDSRILSPGCFISSPGYYLPTLNHPPRILFGGILYIATAAPELQPWMQKVVDDVSLRLTAAGLTRRDTVTMMYVVVTNGAIRCVKRQLNLHHQLTNTPLFMGRMPFLLPNYQRTSLKRKSMTFHGLAHSKLILVFQTCLWLLKAAGYLGGRLWSLSSAFWYQYPANINDIVENNVTRLSTVCSNQWKNTHRWDNAVYLIGMSQLFHFFRWNASRHWQFAA